MLKTRSHKSSVESDTSRLDSAVLNTTDVKRHLAEVAHSVRRSRTPANLGPTSTRARYRLSPADALPQGIVAVRVGVDEARKHFFAIRSLLEVEDDIAFGIEVDGEVIAVLHRHPEYTMSTAARYRETWRALQVLQRGNKQSLAQRNAELEKALEQAVAILGRKNK
jgi:hypothetical protein